MASPDVVEKRKIICLLDSVTNLDQITRNCLHCFYLQSSFLKPELCDQPECLMCLFRAICQSNEFSQINMFTKGLDTRARCVFSITA
jgi:hypothetical protein